MSATFRQLTASFGAEVSRVDIAAGVSDADISRIVALFNAYSVLVFRGLPLEEGRALIGRLTRFSVQAAYTHTHGWQPQDCVIWDNRCCLHRGRPWDKATYARVMHRTTVMGIGPTAE